MKDKFYKLPTDARNPLLINGDAFQEIKMFKDNSLDSIISDLPYLIEFMDLEWDKSAATTSKDYIKFFKEAIRVLKPGGKMAIFTGSINYDLFVNWARFAGFEVMPMITWDYASGMPHGINIVKYLIKQNHLDIADAWKVDKFTVKDDDYRIVVSKDGEVAWLDGTIPKMFKKFKKSKRSDKTSKDLLLSKLRYLHAEYFGFSVITYDKMKSSDYPSGYKYRALFRNRSRDELMREGEWTPFMERYDGFNTGLKPAVEPIANLMKPISESTIIKNILKWGTGSYNIKDCMIPLEGMEGVNIDSFITQMKVNMGLLPPEEVEEQNVNIDVVIKDMENMASVRGKDAVRLNDNTFAGTSIPERLNSGGGGSNIELDKALTDIKHRGVKVFTKDSNDIVFGSTKQDSYGSRVSKEDKANLDKTFKDIKSRFDAKATRAKTNDLTFGSTKQDSYGSRITGKDKGKLDKAIKDIKNQTFGISKATDGITFSGTNIADRMNSGGGTNTKLIDKIAKQIEKRSYDFNPMTQNDETFTPDIRDALSSGGGNVHLPKKQMKKNINLMKKASKQIGKQIVGFNPKTNTDNVLSSSSRDSLTGGGGTNQITKNSMKDLMRQVGGDNRRAKTTIKTLDNNRVYDGSKSDSLNAGGRAIPDANFDKMKKDLQNQVVGFNPKTVNENTFQKNLGDTIHGGGNTKSEMIQTALKFMKGSHEMYGSSGSGVLGHNKDGKMIKKDVDEIVKSTKTIHRKINLKASGSGVHGFNKEKDLSEAEMRKLSKDVYRPAKRIGKNKRVDGIGHGKGEALTEDERRKLQKGTKRLHQKGRGTTKAKTFGYDGLTRKEQKNIGIPLSTVHVFESDLKNKKRSISQKLYDYVYDYYSKIDPVFLTSDIGYDHFHEIDEYISTDEYDHHEVFERLKEMLVITKNSEILEELQAYYKLIVVVPCKPNVPKLEQEMKNMKTRHDPQKHKGALFGNADIPMDNNTFAMLTFFDKMLGRYPSNLIITESGALNKAVLPKGKKGVDYDKIFLIPKPTPTEKLKGIPKKYHKYLHKTIKPINLMSHLVKLLTPRGGIVADFFMGSGSTIVAAKMNNVKAIGVEMMKHSYIIAKYRVRSVDVQTRIRLR